MKKQSIAIIAVIAVVLSLAIGYALFSDKLTINGTATAQGNFDVNFTKASVSTQVGSTGATATIDVENANQLNINVPKLEYPGAYVEIDVTVTNQGSIPAILESIGETGLTTDQSVKVTYSGLTELKNQQLAQNGTQSFKIKVTWDQSSNQSSSNVQFTITLNYKQITAS